MNYTVRVGARFSGAVGGVRLCGDVAGALRIATQRVLLGKLQDESEESRIERADGSSPEAQSDTFFPQSRMLHTEFVQNERSSMSEITVDIPDDTLEALKESPETAGDTLRMAAAVKLYEMARLSTGAAARLAGVPRSVFLIRLADYGVDTFDLDETDLDEETRLA